MRNGGREMQKLGRGGGEGIKPRGMRKVPDMGLTCTSPACFIGLQTETRRVTPVPQRTPGPAPSGLYPSSPAPARDASPSWAFPDPGSGRVGLFFRTLMRAVLRSTKGEERGDMG